MLSIFSCASLEKMSIQVFCPFFDWDICFYDIEHMSYLYSLGIIPLPFTSFANIFSHSVGCLFILLMVYFAVQKLLSLIRYHLFIFAFISISLGD